MTQRADKNQLVAWASKLKDADAGLPSIRKFYQVFFKLPIAGERNVYVVLTDYGPSDIVTLKSDDGFLNQRFQIRIKIYHHHTVMQVTQSYGRASALFQYSVGMVLRHATKIHLQRAATIIEKRYKILEHGKEFLSLT
ncbi:uncharacterized protein LOC107270156 [Cephus cinctus]|uniref:Uncharacterized protein LOC107270156 n=1 Tax=Cephus cinctus TaxID=211228 RepID=A0AAJ7W3U6_CEPCN|nr:uncharacterized protein LOC107270156 [Cephus cinctus]